MGATGSYQWGVMAILWMWLLASYVCAQEAERLAPVLVTDRYVGSAADLAGSVSILDRTAIDRAGARNLVEVLAQVPGVQPRSLFSNGKRSGVDLRGQGDTNTSNVLVLVDGVRLNFDQAGADLTSLSLDSIERIEVYRGAQGVRFGAGGVGGVISIITRRPVEPQFASRLRVGSHGQRRISAHADMHYAGLGVVAEASRDRDLGYRQNSDFAGVDQSLRFNWDLPKGLQVFGLAAWHEDDFGLPGPVSLAAYQTESGRQSATSLTERGASREQRWQMGLAWEKAHYGMRADYSQRQREASFFQADSLAAPNLLDADLSQGNALGYLEGKVLGFDLRADAGGEWRDGAGENYRGGRDQPATVRTLIDQSTRAGFGLLQVKPWRWLSATIGYRSESSEVAFARAQFTQSCAPGPTVTGPDRLETTIESRPVTVTRIENIPVEFGGVIFLIPTPITFVITEEIAKQILIPGSPLPTPDVCGPYAYREEDSHVEQWEQAAREVSLLFRPLDTLDIYLRQVDSFRIPNIDDLNLASADLQPQSGIERELGLRWYPHRRWTLELAAYTSHTDDEIYLGLDPETDLAINRNYASVVKRRGADLSMQVVIGERFEFRSNLTHISARFADGGGRIPLVPELSGSFVLDWQVTPAHRLSATSQFAASRLDGNEFDSARFARVPGWHVESLQWAWRSDRSGIYAGVNNMRDVAWADSVYSESYYPLAGREWYAELSLQLP